jgi:hypothetical protein
LHADVVLGAGQERVKLRNRLSGFIVAGHAAPMRKNLNK